VLHVEGGEELHLASEHRKAETQGQRLAWNTSNDWASVFIEQRMEKQARPTLNAGT
jgi:hypothetical protein